MSKVILITGCSSGFGRTSAEILASRGFRVMATMRDTNDRNARAKAELEAKGVEVLELDVTNQVSVDSAVREVLLRTEGIDVVINNAGRANIGIAEAYTPEQLLELFETNVFGVHRVNRAVLPSMRARRSGLLIHVSSVAGRISAPYMAPYCSSKFALEAIADALRMELFPFGIDSVVVEPGVFETPIFGKVFKADDTETVHQYTEAGANFTNRIEEGFQKYLSDENLLPVSRLVDVFVGLIEAPAGQRPFRTYIGGWPNMLDRYNGEAEELRSAIAQGFDVSNLLGEERARATAE